MRLTILVGQILRPIEFATENPQASNPGPRHATRHQLPPASLRLVGPRAADHPEAAVRWAACGAWRSGSLVQPVACSVLAVVEERLLLLGRDAEVGGLYPGIVNEDCVHCLVRRDVVPAGVVEYGVQAGDCLRGNIAAVIAVSDAGLPR